LLDSREELVELEAEKEKTGARYREAAAVLHRCRVESAGAIAGSITAMLESLGMPGGEFSISVVETDRPQPSRHGSDLIEFLVCTNPGQAPQPLRKVASGGELSRISLAIQVMSRNERIIPTLVFDEVDAGIGGGIAEIVGKLLYGLTEKYQVFCVTHLPQVASLGHNHLLVNKSTHAKTTLTRVTALDEQGTSQRQ